MTKGQLKTALAVADAKGLPDSAEVQFDAAAISDSYEIQLGKVQDSVDPAAAEVVEVPAVFNLMHKS